MDVTKLGRMKRQKGGKMREEEEEEGKNRFQKEGSFLVYGALV